MKARFLLLCVGLFALVGCSTVTAQKPPGPQPTTGVIAPPTISIGSLPIVDHVQIVCTEQLGELFILSPVSLDVAPVGAFDGKGFCDLSDCPTTAQNDATMQPDRILQRLRLLDTNCKPAVNALRFKPGRTFAPINRFHYSPRIRYLSSL